MNTNPPTTARKRLDSWKEIAEYVGRDVRTAMRWEQDGLPVRSVPGGQRRGVFAFTDEIDEWLASRDREPAAMPVDAAADDGGPARGRERRIGRRYVLLAAGLVTTAVLLAAGWLLYRHRNHDLVFHLPGQEFRFKPVATIPLQGQLGGMITADLNGDGWSDLVVGGGPTSQFAVLINHQGKFGLPAYQEGCSTSVGPAVGDFDGDGNADIVLACNRNSQVQVWWGDGKGGFHAPVMLPSGSDPIRCAAGDFNHDGISDFAVDAAGGGPITIYLGHHDRTFTRINAEAGSNPHAPAVADVNGDGNLDMVSACYATGCRNLSLLLGNGDGTFKPVQEFISPGASWAVFVSDLNGDGIPDLFAETISGEASFFSGIGQGKFLPPKLVARPLSAALAGLFSDGGRNYVVELQQYPYAIRMLSFDGQGEATISNNVPVDENARSAAQADYNRDGRNELAILFMRKNESYITIYERK